MLGTKIEEKGDGIFIPRKLLDELEIDEANVLISVPKLKTHQKVGARKLRGIVKTRLTIKELEELYHTGV